MSRIGPGRAGSWRRNPSTFLYDYKGGEAMTYNERMSSVYNSALQSKEKWDHIRSVMKNPEYETIARMALELATLFVKKDGTGFELRTPVLFSMPDGTTQEQLICSDVKKIE
jgi:hypothetical protein